MILQFNDAAVQPLWSGLDLAVDGGEIVCVLGPNGVGKSTLLRTILGTQPLSQGSVAVNGRVGYIPQQSMFPQDLPVRSRDLVSLAMEHRMLRRGPKKKDVDKALARVGALTFADQLSRYCVVANASLIGPPSVR